MANIAVGMNGMRGYGVEARFEFCGKSSIVYDGPSQNPYFFRMSSLSCFVLGSSGTMAHYRKMDNQITLPVSLCSVEYV